jgi:putative nucleotidyltransferase with HDIG domain
MVHVLLPAGSDGKEREAPGRYARSGVPLLLREMEKLGASRSGMAAVVVGGASMLTDRALSVEMNIGEKNGDMVRKILDVEGIPVLRQDLGGHCARIVHLDMATGEADVRTVGEERQKPKSSGTNGKVGLSTIKLKIERLKPISQVARKVMSRVELSSLSELETDIVQDQALTANILKACNSAYYGYSSRVPSLKRAFVLMGLEALRRIILSASLIAYYSDERYGYSTQKGDLMKHSFSCGLIAELIAKEKKLRDPDVAFTAGLLHDIGKVVLDQFCFEQFNLITDRVSSRGGTFIDAEDEVLGFDHARVGRMVAAEWNLPDVLTEAISFHHHPEACRANCKLVSAVHLADNISSMFGEGCGLDELSNRIHQSAISHLDLTKGDVERIVEQLPDVVKQLEMI